jgi:hypothetical protein
MMLLRFLAFDTANPARHEWSLPARDKSFCSHGICGSGVFVAPDALYDEGLSRNPLVTFEPKIRFHAGAPLITSGGQALVTLCVIDTVPRQLSPEHEQALRILSHRVKAYWKRESANIANPIAECLSGAAQKVGTATAVLNNSQAVSLTSSTDGGIPVTSLSVTNNLSSLPSAWNSGSESCGWATVGKGTCCPLSGT